MAVHSLSYTASANYTSASSRDVLIFFISGNPGLIDYYSPFFESLRTLIDSSSDLKSSRFHIYGQDLAGFGEGDHEPFNRQHPPHDVEYQVKNSYDALSALRVEGGPKKGQPYDDILLMGHSVGSYIALQIFHRHLRDPSPSAAHVHLRAGILLFPTIEHIGRSRQGKQMELLRRTPVVGPNAHAIAQGFLRLWPLGALRWFVSTVLRFPAHAAEVTARFLKSRDGVWQALHMGMDEMQVIGEDRWDEELWEIERDVDAQDSKQLPPKFFFFFGKNDHWVASHLRDAFIERRQKQTERTRLMIDEGNLPHAFCISKSSPFCRPSFVNDGTNMNIKNIVNQSPKRC